MFLGRGELEVFFLDSCSFCRLFCVITSQIKKGQKERIMTPQTSFLFNTPLRQVSPSAALSWQHDESIRNNANFRLDLRREL